MSNSQNLLRVPRGLGLVNAYLVREDDGLTLVDTTFGGGTKKILAAAAELDAPILRILLTHAHDDHVGSLDALALALPNAEVLISGRDARLLAGDKTLDPDEPQTKLRGGLKGTKTTPTRTLEAGDHVGSLLVLAAPGHTPGHIALLDERDGTLYSADAFTTIGTVATTAKMPWQFPFAAGATWHKPTELASAQALRALDPARLAPGHGRVIEAPAAAMDRAIARAA
jgi:glyoxylase-like metal-dependent hydrolase (beta-lactamase superfamily II)